MLRKIITCLSVLFSIIFASPPGLTQQEWVLIERGNQGTELFIDKSSIKRFANGNRRENLVLYLQYMRNERENTKIYAVFLVDCETSMFAIMSQKNYELNSGRLLNSVEYGLNAKMELLRKDSILQSGAIFACTGRQ
ncbi:MULTISPECIES: surface-adhesin E family protein [Planktothrix]|uniref:Surface-adhesin protein E-like domain-containing protein n=1 Tax=Planktothrix rubescens CCAP 1459/22 TaxID=329571 RepID=A0A6J7ZTM7_PLARU|nr:MULTISPECIES: surface-adhesin E family protein [Planktothrix]CAC5345276.1 exported hypothetical protein [Planktothrix rubescens NIVA-CYA 18]CAD5961450.1 hypothetical protein PCC7821_03188 [Planktothrix rubescens NIVA-CYA 18]